MPEAKQCYTKISQAIMVFEKVTMTAKAEYDEEARFLCGPDVRIMPMQMDDSWIRDIGPIFVLDLKGGWLALTGNSVSEGLILRTKRIMTILQGCS